MALPSTEPRTALTAQDPQSITSEALRDAVTNERTRGFYEANGWQAVWTGAAAGALDNALAGRARHGLDRIDFLTLSDGATGVQAEVARTDAALRYAEALAHGMVDPGEKQSLYTIARPEVDVASGLSQALSQNRLGDWLNGLAPQTDAYAKLSSAYRDYSGRNPGDASSTIADTDLIHVGDSDARVPTIVAALRQGDYLPGDGEAGGGGPEAANGAESDAPEQDMSQLYTQKIADAVKALQRDYGIVEDGIMGPDTIAVLNLGPGDRARELAVSLERMRWLSRTPPATRIDVNTAAARLTYFRDGKPVDDRKVIVGEPGHETPQLGSPIYRLVANPTWTVPRSIQRNELSGLSTSQLRARNMEWRNGWIVQRSGPDNALGQVKFDMRNEHAIYLHDTGSPSLFERSERHLSHGCVRVYDALAFAQMIAEQQGVSDEWKKARDSGDETFVALPEAIPVRLIYSNVYVDRNGEVAFRTDPYGWNGPIAKALGFSGGSKSASRAKSGDIGP